jgi:exopolyphosphatase/guanosine-5'-triphosphate,3'-diphosphate pyrophosphatase
MSQRTANFSRDPQAKRFAVIDLGSNSWRLVVFTYSAAGWWRHSDELYEGVRIGEGIDGSGRLAEEAIERGLETLRVFQHFCKAEGIDPEDVNVFATSAIRDATNRAEFLARAREATGYEVHVLSAREEAHYGYIAAINTSTMTDGVTLDIGGGSMQLTHVVDRREQESASLAVGAVRMTERFFGGQDPKRPASKRDLQRLRRYLERQLDKSAPWLRGRGGALVATGGAVRNLAEASQRLELAASGAADVGVQGWTLTADALSELVRRLSHLPVVERKTMRGIKSSRGDIILASAVALETVLSVGGIDGMEVTEAGLRDGIFFSRALLDEDHPLLERVRRTGVLNLALQTQPNLAHPEHVAELALAMHRSLADAGLFKSKPAERALLWAAAMLHDIGMTISYDDHHKHSSYMILNSPLPGYSPRERALVAQIARYHRKGTPKLGTWSKLAVHGDAELLSRCAICVRLAEHLERGHDQSVKDVALIADENGTAIRIEGDGDLALPRWSLGRYGDDEAFQQTFGRRLLIDSPARV